MHFDKRTLTDLFSLVDRIDLLVEVYYAKNERILRDILENPDCLRIKIRPFDCPKVFSTHTDFPMTFTNYQLVLNCKTYLRVRYRLVAPTLRFRYTRRESREEKDLFRSNTEKCKFDEKNFKLISANETPRFFFFFLLIPVQNENR